MLNMKLSLKLKIAQHEFKLEAQLDIKLEAQLDTKLEAPLETQHDAQLEAQHCSRELRMKLTFNKKLKLKLIMMLNTLLTSVIDSAAIHRRGTSSSSSVSK